MRAERIYRDQDAEEGLLILRAFFRVAHEAMLRARVAEDRFPSLVLSVYVCRGKN